MRKRKPEEALVAEVVQSSVAVVREAHQVSEDSEADTREQDSNPKDEVATNIMTIEVDEVAEEVEDSAGGIMTSHNGTETHLSTFDQTGR